MRMVRIERYGGPEVLQLCEAPLPAPGPGQARVKLEAVGVNFLDVYHRTGLYPNPLPFTPGVEGAGRVDALGPGVTGFREGDRVAYTGPLGAYAEEAVVPADRLVMIPAGMESNSAAAVMLQGMTAQYLTASTFPLRPGHTCLVHAAAGGVGLLLAQMARRRGARVLGTVSTEAKATLARAAGVDEAILYTKQDFLVEVQRATGGRGVDVVYDSVGQVTFEKSLGCLAPMGMLVLYGQSSGTVPPLDLSLVAKGSLFVTRPSLYHYIRDRQSLEERAAEVLGGVASGQLRLHIERTYPLAEVAEAHRALEARKTVGKVLLSP